MIPKLAKDHHILVTVMDKDLHVDDRVGQFKIFPYKVMNEGRNGKTIKYSIHHEDDYVNVRTTWIPLN